MIHCQACGQELPPQANFCARCGVRLSGRSAAPWWILALFSVGAFLMLYSTASTGASLYLEPSIGADPSKVTAAYLIIAFSAVLSVVQVVAIAGLALKREWGRMAATLACAGWVLTCIGIPLSIVVLRELWRIRPSPARSAQ